MLLDEKTPMGMSWKCFLCGNGPPFSRRMRTAVSSLELLFFPKNFYVFEFYINIYSKIISQKMCWMSKIVVLQLLLSTLTKFVRHIIAVLLWLHEGLSTKLEKILSLFYERLHSMIRGIIIINGDGLVFTETCR